MSGDKLTGLAAVDQELHSALRPRPHSWLSRAFDPVSNTALVTGALCLLLSCLLMAALALEVSVMLWRERESWALRSATCDMLSRGPADRERLEFLARNCVPR